MVGIICYVAKAEARDEGEWRAVGDAYVVRFTPLTEQQISRGEEDGGDALHCYGEAGTWKNVSMLAAMH